MVGDVPSTYANVPIFSNAVEFPTHPSTLKLLPALLLTVTLNVQLKPKLPVLVPVSRERADGLAKSICTVGACIVTFVQALLDVVFSVDVALKQNSAVVPAGTPVVFTVYCIVVSAPNPRVPANVKLLTTSELLCTTKDALLWFNCTNMLLALYGPKFFTTTVILNCWFVCTLVGAVT